MSVRRKSERRHVQTFLIASCPSAIPCPQRQNRFHGPPLPVLVLGRSLPKPDPGCRGEWPPGTSGPLWTGDDAERSPIPSPYSTRSSLPKRVHRPDPPRVPSPVSRGGSGSLHRAIPTVSVLGRSSRGDPISARRLPARGLTPANLQPQPPAATGKTAFIMIVFQRNEPSVFPIAAGTAGTMPAVGQGPS